MKCFIRVFVYCSCLFSVFCAIFLKDGVVLLLFLGGTLVIGLSGYVIDIVKSLLGHSPPITLSQEKSYGLYCIIFAQIICIPVASFLNQTEIDDAQKYCERIIDTIEHRRSIDGYYPQNISNLMVNDELPSLLRARSIYTRLGNSYDLEFTDNQMVIAKIYRYSSISKKWTVFD